MLYLGEKLYQATGKTLCSPPPHNGINFPPSTKYQAVLEYVTKTNSRKATGHPSTELIHTFWNILALPDIVPKW